MDEIKIFSSTNHVQNHFSSSQKIYCLYNIWTWSILVVNGVFRNSIHIGIIISRYKFRINSKFFSRLLFRIINFPNLLININLISFMFILVYIFLIIYLHFTFSRSSRFRTPIPFGILLIPYQLYFSWRRFCIFMNFKICNKAITNTLVKLNIIRISKN